MNDDKEPIVLVLGAVRAGVTPTRGSTLVVADCGHQAWISPNAVRVVNEDPGRVSSTCDDCVDMAEMFGKTMDAVPGGVEDAARHLGISAGEIEDMFNRMTARHGGRRAKKGEI